MMSCLAHSAWSQDLMAASATNAPEPIKEYETGNIGQGTLAASREYASRNALYGHFHDFLEDQGRIWSSPARVRMSDAAWLVPLGGLAAGLFATDRQHSASLSQNPSTIHRYNNVSNFGLASL